MTRDANLNRRIWDEIALAAREMACEDVTRAKLRGDTQETRKAQERASEALHKIMGKAHG